MGIQNINERRGHTPKGWMNIGIFRRSLVAGVWMAVCVGLWHSSVVAIATEQGLLTSASPITEPRGNQLAGESSPYLREAAHQPVHWLPWGSEAFQRAQQEDKPILLDIGAVWCHWCHVMDAESYENPEIASLINEHFVAIKVDMDERPDIDRRYQEAVQALSGQGGWPLTAFLTPEGHVFYGGTYFPPTTRGDRVGLKSLLPELVRVYTVGRSQVEANASQLASMLVQFGSDSLEKGHVSEELIEIVATSMVKEFDPVNGGFGTRAKFPAGSAIELSLARYFLYQDQKMLEIVTKTLDTMAHGGVYDHLGGGFFRYATDLQWTVPHFEKMNYDNAELLMNYLHAYQATGKTLYRDVAKGIIRYVNRVLSNQDTGGFYAHQDADMTREDDGDYYTWTVQEVRQALSQDEAEVILRYYGIQALGEMHKNPRKNVLLINTTPEAIAQELKIPVDQVTSLVDQGTQNLYRVRLTRKAPLVDQTIYADRNGMMISAYLEAYRILEDEEAKAFALKTLDLLLEKVYREGQGMYHAYFEGHARVSGLLNDQVQIANAALDAFEVTGEARYLHVAKDLMDYAITELWDAQAGGFFDRVPEEQTLGALQRSFKDVDDNPTASPNGVAAAVLDRLASLTNREVYAQKTRETLEAFAGSAPRYGRFMAAYALAVQYHLNRPAQAVIIGKKKDQRTQDLWTAALTAYRPGKIVATYDPTTVNLNTLPPAVAGAVRVFGVKGEPRAYICAGVTCAPPTTDPHEVVALVRTYGITKPQPQEIIPPS